MDMQKLFPGEESFIRVAENYYNKNFGTMTKSELELLMFTILYEKREEQKMAVDDVSLAFALGISVQRVDGLKEKMMLKKSEDELDKLQWKEKVSELIQKKAVTYDASAKSFSIIVSDVFVFYKAIEALRNNNLPYQETAKPRGLILSEAAFVAIAYECCDSAEKKKSFEETVKNYLPDHNIGEMLNGKSFGRTLLDVGGGILLSSVKTFDLCG